MSIPTGLIDAVVKNSLSSEWESAKSEWELDGIYVNRFWDICVCGQPIKQCCIIKNKHNDQELLIGSTCATNFMDMNAQRIFRKLRDLSVDINKSVGRELLDIAYTHGTISQWEYNFYVSIYRKRKLSDKQLNIKHKLNLKILNSMVKGSAKVEPAEAQKGKVQDAQNLMGGDEKMEQKNINEWVLDDQVEMKEYELVPEGLYLAVYAGTQKRESKDSKTGEVREYYLHKWTLPDKNTDVYETTSLTLSRKSKLGQIAQALGVVIEAGTKITLSDLIGKKCKLLIKHEEVNGMEYHKISDHLKL